MAFRQQSILSGLPLFSHKIYLLILKEQAHSLQAGKEYMYELDLLMGGDDLGTSSYSSEAQVGKQDCLEDGVLKSGGSELRETRGGYWGKRTLANAALVCARPWQMFLVWLFSI